MSTRYKGSIMAATAAVNNSSTAIGIWRTNEILQAITDPENQPSQFGTVTLEYHQEKMKQWEDLFDRMSANFERASDKAIAQRIVPPYTIQPQRTEQNFCSRCGKRTNDIHICTPPQD